MVCEMKSLAPTNSTSVELFVLIFCLLDLLVIVGNEICSGTERENFKPGTTGTESIRMDEKDTTDNATHA